MQNVKIGFEGIIRCRSYGYYTSGLILRKRFYINDMIHLHSMQKLRFQLGKAIPGTRSFRFFRPTDRRTLKFKRTSIDIGFAGEHSLKRIKQIISTNYVRMIDFVCCKYDDFFWVGMVTNIEEKSHEMHVNFMHLHGSNTSFFWPEREGFAFVPYRLYFP